MTTTRSRTSRAAALALALTGALGLSACGDDATVETANPSAPVASSTSAPTAEASATTEAAPTTEPSAPPTAESPTTSESSSASTSAAASAPGDLKVTPKGTRLKYGQPGIIDEGDDGNPQILKLTVKKLEVAPESAYAETKLTKADGTLYYLTYDVTNVQADEDESVNRRFLHPDANAGMMGPKVLYGSTAGCKTDLGADLPVGQTVQECVIYHIPGKVLTETVYEASGEEITWTK